jgi:ADP-heptose:LPS heptosyltransferase
VLTDEDKACATRLFESLGLTRRRPVVGIHPSGGRRIKQWPVERWGTLAARLQGEFGATVLLSGALSDAPLCAEIARALPAPPVDLSGKLGVRELMAVLERLDLFLSPDTGPMHMACAVGTRSVSVFGPSDPQRYFSGGSGAPGTRHVVVRRELWCAPCNLIRKPPAECARAHAPECLDAVTVESVFAEAARALREAGHRARGDA